MAIFSPIAAGARFCTKHLQIDDRALSENENMIAEEWFRAARCRIHEIHGLLRPAEQVPLQPAGPGLICKRRDSVATRPEPHEDD
jgi:hypothetical protein